MFKPVPVQAISNHEPTGRVVRATLIPERSFDARKLSHDLVDTQRQPKERDHCLIEVRRDIVRIQTRAPNSHLTAANTNTHTLDPAAPRPVRDRQHPPDGHLLAQQAR
jgi:hypothetical protein